MNKYNNSFRVASLSDVLDFIPRISNGKAAYEVITGKNLITREVLSTSDRITSGAGVIVPGVKGASKVVKAVTKSTKSVNSPFYKPIKLDMDHITSGHTTSGGRANQSGKKDVFPSKMTDKQIENAIIDAYKNGKK
ncbi:pre-toxin TG domain-containing protein [Lysinibacillus sp. LZ02]|uniref:pre-toxin TG domain-containing protein n=1 Tax=Lysinibacillus sp. LZ02 TaxID=3420668 RepID=UPI003D35F66A